MVQARQTTEQTILQKEECETEDGKVQEEYGVGDGDYFECSGRAGGGGGCTIA